MSLPYSCESCLAFTYGTSGVNVLSLKSLVYIVHLLSSAFCDFAKPLRDAWLLTLVRLSVCST